MAVWLLRAGTHGERDQFALEKGVAAIAWEQISDLMSFTTREEIITELTNKYPDEGQRTIRTWASELFSFSRKIEIGDYVAMPVRDRSTIYIGRVIGDYQFKPDFPKDSRHTREVHWLDEYPRTAFRQEMLRSLGSLLTVGRVRREYADADIEALIEGQAPPELGADDEIEAEDKENIEQFSRDQISSYIQKKFREHDLERLVGAVLEAQGYKVRVTPIGPDGGIDILAGSGPLGFDPPRLAVQVKSGQSPVDITIVREFSGVMSRFGAEHGLVVSWSGFRGTVERETAQDYFKIRLWDAEDLVKNIQNYYDRLPEDIQAELPLKKIWILLPEEE
jgi:restriction system protein